MNRFKLILVLLVLTFVGILLGQNRQLLTLKLFCPDVTEPSCLVSTPALPLSVWIGIFAIAGIVSSLIWQFLNQAGNTSKNRGTSTNKKSDNLRSVSDRGNIRKKDKAKVKSTSRTDWEQPVSEDWETDEPLRKTQDEFTKTSTVDRQKTRIEDNTNSAYSYKSQKIDLNKSEESLENSHKKIETQRSDDVYDANYRTVNSPQSKDSDSYDDNEEWIS